MKHFIQAFKLYGVFSGRSTREEYWMFTLIYIVVYMGLSAIAFSFNSETFNIAITILSFGVILPSLSITSRRLHDMGRSGWWQVSPYIGIVFLGIGAMQESNLLMIAGGIVMMALFIAVFVFLVVPSDDDNKYGAKPNLP